MSLRSRCVDLDDEARQVIFQFGVQKQWPAKAITYHLHTVLKKQVRGEDVHQELRKQLKAAGLTIENDFDRQRGSKTYSHFLRNDSSF